MFKKISLKMPSKPPPSVVPGQDPKPMQTLILAEKAVLLSLQKLSVDYAKAAEALKSWGLTEKDDLGHVLTTSTSLLNHFSLAVSQYVAHGNTMQHQLEAMSKKVDTLDDLKQRRNEAHRKAEETSKQLSKMDPQNMYYGMHLDSLKRLRKDVRKMDTDIKTEDAALDDFKRTATKVWMTLKLGGLRDCCEKGMIAGKYGKFAANEISEENTQSGKTRGPYSPHKVDNFLTDAERHIGAVGHSMGIRDIIQSVPASSNPSPPISFIELPSTSGSQASPNPSSQHHNNANYHQASEPLNGNGSHFSDRVEPAPPHQPRSSQGTVNFSGGYTLHDPPLGGHRPSFSGRSVIDPSVSGGMSHPQDPRSSEPRGYTLQDQRTSGGYQRESDSSFDRYPSRDQGGRHPNSDSSFPTGPPYGQNSDQFPTHPRPLAEPGRYLQDPSSSGGPHRAGNSSFPAGPSSQSQNPRSDRLPIPPRPTGSSDPALQDPRYRNGDSSYSEGTSHRQNPAPRPPGQSESGRYPSQRLPPLPESQRYPDPSHLRHPNNNSSGKSEFGEYASQDSRLLGGHGDSSFSEPRAGPSQWATSRSSGSQLSLILEGATLEGPSGGRAGSLRHNRIDSWIGPSLEDIPPAYTIEHDHDPMPDTAGHSSVPGPTIASGRW